MSNGKGLKQQWGVGDPAKAGSDKQSQKFQASFQQEIGVINGHLQYTSANAEADKHNPLAGRRDALYPAYQAALGQIDRTDPTKAQGAIDTVLGDGKALCTEAAALHKAAEKALKDWKAREPKYDAAVHQIEELEAWGDDKAAPLRGLVDRVRTQTNTRSYAQAAQIVDQLLPKLQPIYDDYQKQKAAKPKYEQAQAEQTARLDALKAAERPSQPMKDKAAEADTALGPAREKGDAKDYVGGSEQMKAAQTALDALDKLAKDPQRTKFLADRKAADDAVNAPRDTSFPELEADWNALVPLKDQADPLADAGDYAGANKLLAEMKTKLTEYEKKLQKAKDKKAYEAVQATLKPKLDDALLMAKRFDTLKKQRDALVAGNTAVQAAVKGEDFAKALQLVNTLQTNVDAYLAKATTEEEKYTKKGEEIDQLLKDASDDTRAGVAMAAANKLTPPEIKHLPTAVRNRLLSEMQKDDLTNDEKKASKKLFSQRYLDPEFEKLDKASREEMIKNMKNDPAFKHARDNWDTLTEAERVAIMQKAVDYQATAYGVPPTTIETYSEDDPTDYGYYVHSDGKLYVNGHDSALKDGGFDYALDTAVHENGHRYQSTLIDRLDGRVPPPIIEGDPLFNQATTFKLNDVDHGFFVQPPEKRRSPDTGKEYFTQPKEAHSRITGAAVQRAGVGK